MQENREYPFIDFLSGGIEAELQHEIDSITKELKQTTDHDQIEFLVEEIKLANKKLRRLSLS